MESHPNYQRTPNFTAMSRSGAFNPSRPQEMPGGRSQKFSRKAYDGLTVALNFSLMGFSDRLGDIA